MSPARFPVPTRKDHQKFCLAEGWVQVRNSQGNTGHHITYELALPDGRTIRTRISHPPTRDTYGRSMWSHILRDQLDVTEAEFWACVRDGVKPTRGRTVEPPAEAIPAGIVRELIANGVPEDEVRNMSKADAIKRITAIWSQQR